MHPQAFTRLLCLAQVVLQVSARATDARAEAGSGKAIYMITNDKINAIIALPIGAASILSAGTYTATGSAGSNSIDGTTNQAAAPDALVSQ